MIRFENVTFRFGRDEWPADMQVAGSMTEQGLPSVTLKRNRFAERNLPGEDLVETCPGQDHSGRTYRSRVADEQRAHFGVGNRGPDP